MALTRIQSYAQLGILAAALAVGVGFAAALRTVHSSERAHASMERAQEVRIKLAETLAPLKGINANARSYIIAGDERSLSARKQSLAEFDHALAGLRELVGREPDEQAALTRLETQVAAAISLYDQYAELRRVSGVAAATARAGDGELKRVSDEIKAAVAYVQQVESQRLAAAMEDLRRQSQLARMILASGLVLALGLAVTMSLLIRHEFRIRAEAERVVAKARAYAESIVHSVREPLLILTPDLRVDSANQRFHANFQLAPEEVAGRPLADIGTGAWGNPTLQAALAQLASGGEPLVDFKLEADFPNVGRRIMLLNAGKLVESGAGVPLLLLALEDVTHREQMQAELEHERYLLGELMDNSTECIYFKDADCRFTRINRGLAQRFGLAEPAAALGKTDFDFYAAEHARAAFEDEQTVMRSGKPVIKEEKETWPDGHVSWVLTVKLPLRDAQRRIVGTYGLSRDITERKQAEGRLEELNAALKSRGAELEAANRELEAFSYSVSHDLRAPLRHIDYFATALEKRLTPEQLDDKSRRHIASMSQTARSMGQLIDDLLAFARLSRAEMRRTRVPLDGLVIEVRQALHREINGRTVDWDVQPLPEVDGDAALLRQVFTNLLSNAIKYTRQRPAARIEVAPHDRAGGAVVVRVRDNGAGFDMKYADKLFGVFQRLHGAHEFEGTGVGLANVRRIVERHGGRVWAEAEVDRGATFYVQLPAAPLPT